MLTINLPAQEKLLRHRKENQVCRANMSLPVHFITEQKKNYNNQMELNQKVNAAWGRVENK